MGKIPALQRKMISRAVGTPGADLSTNQALQTIGLAATLISAKIKKNQIALDKVDALRLSQDVDLDYQKKIGVLQQKKSKPDIDISNYKREAKQA
ncbi:MAG: hypothetical protein GY928_04920 [Colwellia sp.]|nr:hypothetical protein [Colwellia sp.]